MELEEAIVLAISEMEAIPFFPTHEQAPAQGAIMRAILRFCDRLDGLRWLTDTAVERMKKWEGVGELRALYCTRYRPADGLPAVDCTIPGFTPADSEAAYFESQAQETTRKLEAWRRQAAQLPAPEQEENRQLIAALKPRGL
jgi:hypothetical protein